MDPTPHDLSGADVHLLLTRTNRCAMSWHTVEREWPMPEGWDSGLIVLKGLKPMLQGVVSVSNAKSFTSATLARFSLS